MRKEFIIDGTLFSSDIDSGTGTEYVHSSHPYDMQKYYWARRSQKDGEWIVYRGGKTVTSYDNDISIEEIADILSIHDSFLRPIIDHT